MKAPRFLVAACIALALALTFSCSSDSSDDPPPPLLPAQPSSSDAVSSSSFDVGGSSPSDAVSSSSSDVVVSSSSYDEISLSSSDVAVSSSSLAEGEPSSSSAVPVPQYALAINIDPAAGGTVLRDPAKDAYEHGTEVIVTAEPKAGYAFTGWSGALVSTSDEVAVVMDGNKTLTASFALIPPSYYALATHTNDVHGGTVHHSPSDASHLSGTIVTVTATAKFGYAFTGWSGAATGTTNPVAITMDGNKELTASFELADSGTFTDSRDSKTYKWVRIGGKVWMAENLNFGASGSKCYGNDPDKCADYGRLYTWDAAMSACPSGLHLPSNAEWDELYAAAEDSGACSDDSCPTAGKHLKAKTGWKGCPACSGSFSSEAEDTYGFSALPGGLGNGDWFDYASNSGSWWSSSEHENVSLERAYSRLMHYNRESAYREDNIKVLLLSVRCVQD